ncbi:FAR1-related sequence 5-like protein [Tanacetum coccineum]|uniref:FAR1-related sequence 5-like protein n=1 Tax=Tanacetum coccineum TaxID=301880 RepID=A0ABQ5BZF3_9ASTR
MRGELSFHKKTYSCHKKNIDIYSLRSDSWRSVAYKGTPNLDLSGLTQEMTTSNLNYVKHGYRSTLMVKKGCIYVCVVYDVGSNGSETEVWKINEEEVWMKMGTYRVDPCNMRFMKPLHLTRNGNLLMLDLKKKHSKVKDKDKDKETRCCDMEISQVVRYNETIHVIVKAAYGNEFAYVILDDDILMSGIDKNGDLIHGEEEIEVESGEENGFDSANDLCRSFGYSVIGKTFDSADDAYDFYNEYGLSNGFGIRKSYHNKHSVTKEIYRHVFVCNKEGYKDMNDKRTTKNVKRRCIKRTGCNAMIRVKLSNDEKWVVENFLDEHNHPFDIPSHVPRQWSHKSFHRSKECKDLVTLISKEGIIRPSEITKIVNAYRGNHEDKLTRVQCSTIVSGERRRNLGKECHGVIMHFKERLK